VTHFGDPLEDFGWIAVRSLFQSFAPMTVCFAEYELASGTKVESRSGRFYRIYAHVYVLVTFIERCAFLAERYGASIGHMLTFQLYTCASARALADVMGVDFAVHRLAGWRTGPESNYFDIVLRDLRDVVVPHIADKTAAHGQGHGAA